MNVTLEQSAEKLVREIFDVKPGETVVLTADGYECGTGCKKQRQGRGSAGHGDFRTYAGRRWQSGGSGSAG